MQAAFYLELDDGDDRLETPWVDPNDPANCFVDLKTKPGELDRIPEAQDNPPLRRFLAAVNAPDTLFATAKCGTWKTDEFSVDERATFSRAQAKCASYIDLVFSREELNFHREHYEQLARRLLPLLMAAPATARAELCVRRCYFRAVESWGFYLTVFLYGYGRDDDSARTEWAAGLLALESAFLRLSAALQQALRQTGS